MVTLTQRSAHGPSVCPPVFFVRYSVAKSESPGAVSDSLRFEELFRTLSSPSHGILKEKWSILYLLHSLSGDTQTDTAALPAVRDYSSFLLSSADYIRVQSCVTVDFNSFVD